MMYLIIYRPHNKLHCETQFIGPYPDHESAYDELCNMPALGTYEDDGVLNLPGVKWIQELRPALSVQYTLDSARERVDEIAAALGMTPVERSEVL